MLSDVVPAVSDLLAITLIVGIYFHRHQRRDLLLAYIALNVGILAVTATLSSASVGAGLGLGPIRHPLDHPPALRQHYPGGDRLLLRRPRPRSPRRDPRRAPLRDARPVRADRAGDLVADHPRLFARARRALLTLDSAIPDEAQLRAHIENRLGVEVRHMIVQEINFVLDLTIVDVRFRAPVGAGGRFGAQVSTGHGEVDSITHPHPLVTPTGCPTRGRRMCPSRMKCAPNPIGDR